MPELSLEQRKAILNREIQKYVGKGWRVVKQTKTTAEISMPKSVSTDEWDSEGFVAVSGPDPRAAAPGEELQAQGLVLDVDVYGHVGRRPPSYAGRGEQSGA